MAEEINEMFETDEVTAAEDADDSIFEQKSSVVAFVHDRYNRAEDARYGDEQRWLKAYRNYRGLYGPEVQFTETETPTPQADEVLVKIHASSVNYGDRMLVLGKPFAYQINGVWATQPKTQDTRRRYCWNS